MSVRFENRASRHSRPKHQAEAGFTMVELMIAMLLGLIVVGGVVSVFLANQRTYRTNQALGDVQDSARTAFELMSRDIRNAGLTGCDNSGRIANVLTASPGGGGTAQWWANWSGNVTGYSATQTDPTVAIGTSANNRVAGSDSLTLLGGDTMGYSVKTDVEPTGTFTLNETSANLQNGDVVIICTPDHAAITQINSYNAGTTITFKHEKSGSPGNCTKDLSYPTVCSSSSSYVFVPNSQVTKLSAVDWYLGINSAGGKSLYRVSVATVSGVPTATAVEMVRGVTTLTLNYHQTGDTAFKTASAISNWGLVDAVQSTIAVESTDQRAGTDVKPISRTFTATTTIRNRVI